MNITEKHFANHIQAHSIRYANELDERIRILQERVKGLQELNGMVLPNPHPKAKELLAYYNDEITALGLIVEQVRETW